MAERRDPAECPLCGAAIDVAFDAVEGELMQCAECGSELEVVALDPPRLQEAPETEEDWGE